MDAECGARAAPVTAQAAFAELLEKGKEAWRRERHLPALMPCWPEEISDASPGGARRIVGKLERALRAERRRGRAGHWTYDLNRHISLAIALKAETARLAELLNARGRSPVR